MEDGKALMLYGRKPIGTIGYLGGLMAVPEEFAWSWGQMIQYNAEYLCEPGEYVHLNRATLSFHAAARNLLTQQIYGDWLLQFDTDHSFEPDMAARLVYLMNKHDVDVITGVYVAKTWPHPPVLYRWNDDEKLEQLAAWDASCPLIQIGSAGGGNLLVRRRVFERIRKEMNENPFDIIHPFGEDHSFFLRLKRLGIAVYAAPMVSSQHLGVKGYTTDDFDIEAVGVGPRIEVGGLK